MKAKSKANVYILQVIQELFRGFVAVFEEPNGLPL